MTAPRDHQPPTANFHQPPTATNRQPQENCDKIVLAKKYMRFDPKVRPQKFAPLELIVGRLRRTMQNAKRTQTCLQNSPTTSCPPTPNFFLLLDATSHWGVVGKHPLPSPIPCSSSSGWQQYSPSLSFHCCLPCHCIMRHGCKFVQQAVPHLKLVAAWCAP